MRRALSILILTLSGGIATAIGLAILLVPATMFAGNAIVLNAGADLFSEARAPGALLITLGGFILLTVFRPKLRSAGLSVSAAVYLSYGMGRLLSLYVDGHPGDALIQAMAIELCLGAAAAMELVFPRGQYRKQGESA